MFHLDNTGFPAVPVPAAGLAVHLFPVTKVQFEYFLGDRTNFDPAAFDELYGTSPRASWRTIPEDRFEELFLTGLLPEEAERFARWLDDGFRVPTEAEWRAVDAGIAALPPTPDGLREQTANDALHPAARALLNWRLGRGRWPAVGLFEGGLVEWVKVAGGHALHGRPRPDLLRVIHNPQIHEAIRFKPPRRDRVCGVRLVRPLSVGRTP